MGAPGGPDLRIVDQALWTTVQDRLDAARTIGAIDRHPQACFSGSSTVRAIKDRLMAPNLVAEFIAASIAS